MNLYTKNNPLRRVCEITLVLSLIVATPAMMLFAITAGLTMMNAHQ